MPCAVSRSLTNAHRAAVLSDGAAALVEFGLTDWLTMLDVLEHKGPAELLRQIRKVEAADPHGEQHPCLKPGDDAAIAFCVFESS